MSAERWTDEMARLVARALFTQDALDAMSGLSWEDLEDERYDWLRIAAAGLDALADAGLLVEPRSEAREEWGVRYPNLHPEPVFCSDETMARHTAEGAGRTLMTRTVHTGPWREMPDGR